MTRPLDTKAMREDIRSGRFFIGLKPQEQQRFLLAMLDRLDLAERVCWYASDITDPATPFMVEVLRGLVTPWQRLVRGEG